MEIQVKSFFSYQFCRELFKELGGSKAVWSITMGDQAATGHSFRETVAPPPTPSLDKQLRHKAKFIDEYIPKGVKVSIIAYSISCYLLLALIKKKGVAIGTLGDDAGAKLVDSLYFIFPVIERMRDSPLGKIFLPALCYFTWLILAIAFIILMFPNKIKFPIIKKILTSNTGSPPQDQFVTGAIELIHPVMLKRVLNTLKEEIEQVKELDISTIEDNRHKMVFYYGSYDGFCPRKYLYELRERVPDVNAYLCRDSLHHVYVAHSSEQMAHIMGGIMGNKSDERMR
ncbi:lipid droplet-associated hydrolase isoform X2 [Hyalella azteca]|uniref:Lipid droplet-associated hydrolase n=1 Tax=Hyalella azteca TaxID=294128 RepID=A0A8B7PLD7_HYAAZ|nr:lipid droplet-associated hydrolase isoform X2 [Hyalella azteca]